MPLALSLSLVVLAAWGVLLVTRGAVRRALAVLALVAALGVVATVIAGHQTLPGNIRDRLRGLRRSPMCRSTSLAGSGLRRSARWSP